MLPGPGYAGRSGWSERNWLASGCWVPTISAWSRAAAAFALRLAAIALVMASDFRALSTFLPTWLSATMLRGRTVPVRVWKPPAGMSEPIWKRSA